MQMFIRATFLTFIFGAACLNAAEPPIAPAADAKDATAEGAAVEAKKQTPKEFFDSLKNLPPEERSKAIAQWHKQNAKNLPPPQRDAMSLDRQKRFYDAQIQRLTDENKRLAEQKPAKDAAPALKTNADNANKRIELNALEIEELEFRKSLLVLDGAARAKALQEHSNSESFKKLQELRNESIQYAQSLRPAQNGAPTYRKDAEFMKSLEGKTPQERIEMIKQYIEKQKKDKDAK